MHYWHNRESLGMTLIGTPCYVVLTQRPSKQAASVASEVLVKIQLQRQRLLFVIQFILQLEGKNQSMHLPVYSAKLIQNLTARCVHRAHLLSIELVESQLLAPIAHTENIIRLIPTHTRVQKTAPQVRTATGQATNLTYPLYHLNIVVCNLELEWKFAFLKWALIIYTTVGLNNACVLVQLCCEVQMAR